MGRIIVTTIHQLCGRGFNLWIQCDRCQRRIVVEGRQLRRWQMAHRWSAMIGAIAAKFPCRHCGPGSITWGFTGPGGDDILDLDAVARGRRDRLLTRARFWHDLANGRDPETAKLERVRRRIEVNAVMCPDPDDGDR